MKAWFNENIGGLFIAVAEAPMIGSLICILFVLFGGIRISEE